MFKRLFAGRTTALILVVALLLAIVPVAVWAAASTATPLQLSRTATVPTWTQAVTDGVEFENNGRVMLMLRSAEATQDATVVITTPATFFGYAVTDETFTLAAQDTMVIGPFPPNVFNDSSGNVTVVAVEGAGAGTAIVISMTTIRY